jgi:hypothetical protein
VDLIMFSETWPRGSCTLLIQKLGRFLDGRLSIRLAMELYGFQHPPEQPIRVTVRQDQAALDDLILTAKGMGISVEVLER